MHKEEGILYRWSTPLLLCGLATAGLWLRLRNLGELGFILDEGVQGLAVHGILQHGVPKLDSGLVYLRGLSFLYTQAAFAELFKLNHFWLRFPAVLFGVATIFPAYLFGKMLFNRKVGLLCALLLTFSGWEIEFSRYARFYTAFQFFFLLAVFYFYRWFIRNQPKDKLWFFVMALLAFSAHSLSRVLIVYFAIPLFINAEKGLRRWIPALGALGVFGLWQVYGQFLHFMEGFGVNLSPPSAMPPVQLDLWTRLFSYFPVNRFLGPNLDYWGQIVHQRTYLIGAMVMAAVFTALFLVYRSIQTSQRAGQTLLAIMMLLAALLHQFTIVLLLVAVYLLAYGRTEGRFNTVEWRVVLGVNVGLMIAWLFIMTTDPTLSIEKSVMLMFGFPNVISYFFYRFVSGWPLMSIGFGAGCMLLLSRYLTDRTNPNPLFLLGVIFVPIVMTSFFSAYAEARYFFHLYPMIIIVIAMVCVKFGTWILNRLPATLRWGRQLVVGVLILVALFISQDANPIAAWNIGNRTYKTPKDPIKSITNLLPYAGIHQDQETPSRYLKQSMRPGDRIVVFGSLYKLQVYHFYLGRVDYVIKENVDYYWVRDGKWITTITGSEILADLRAVREVIEKGTGGLWVLGDRWSFCEDQCHGFVGCGGAIFGSCWDVYTPPIRKYLHTLAGNPDYVGLDGQTFVVKVR